MASRSIRLAIGLALGLAGACSRGATSSPPDAVASCPDPDPPVGARLACHMVMFLDEAGFTTSQVIVDASTLRASGAESGLAARGFTRRPDDGSARVYELGAASIYENGQRVVLAGDGTIDVTTFASAASAFIETIEIGADGSAVSNDLAQLPP